MMHTEPAATDIESSTNGSNADATSLAELGAADASNEAQAFDAPIDPNEIKRALEAALMAASEPMQVNELRRLFEGQINADLIRTLLEELRGEWASRSVELAVVASGYRFRVRPEYQKYLERLSNDKPLKYSRAVLETLAIIAYRQPVTRADIEDIRGVAVSPHILKTLEDRGWIDEIGHRETVGRPALFATTKHFLDDLNLRSLDELPPLHELQATLDMTQAGAALRLSESPDLPGLEVSNDAADSGTESALESPSTVAPEPSHVAELADGADAVDAANAIEPTDAAPANETPGGTSP
jgi:segregation and condensation protein B